MIAEISWNISWLIRKSEMNELGLPHLGNLHGFCWPPSFPLRPSTKAHKVCALAGLPKYRLLTLRVTGGRGIRETTCGVTMSNHMRLTPVKSTGPSSFFLSKRPLGWHSPFSGKPIATKRVVFNQNYIFFSRVSSRELWRDWDTYHKIQWHFSSI